MDYSKYLSDGGNPYNDRVVRAKAFLKEMNRRDAKKMADKIAATQKKQAEKNKRMGMDKPAVYKPKPTPPPKKDDKIKCYTKTANDGHRYVTCDDKKKKKKKLRRKRLVIVDKPKPVARLLASTVRPPPPAPPFQPDFVRQFNLDPISKRNADMKAARAAVAKAQALRYGGY